MIIINNCIALQYGQIDRVAVVNGHFSVTCQINWGICSLPLEYLHVNVTQHTDFSNEIF
jgi:hypothetical protein